MTDIFIESLISALAVIALGGPVLVLSGASRKQWLWLLFAAALILLHEAALYRLFGLIPNFLYELQLNWIGKVLAILLFLAIACIPAIGWKRSGLHLRFNKDRPLLTWAGVGFLSCIPVAFALLSGPYNPTAEQMAFQLTMPGLDEELFYRGVLLVVLGQAMLARASFLGVSWGWHHAISTLLFGLAHAIGWDGSLSFDTYAFALTGMVGLLLCWVRERTGNLLLPIVLHNWSNAAVYFI